jgi:Domain of unknown function (DUF4280)
MAQAVVNGAMLQCSFGTGPSSMVVLPADRVMVENQPCASIMDFKPNVNIMPFIMCTTPSNPQVAAATAAAMGVLTPQPCIPVTTSPWIPGTITSMQNNNIQLDSNCKCMCTWGGVIQITNPGTTKTTVP